MDYMLTMLTAMVSPASFFIIFMIINCIQYINAYINTCKKRKHRDRFPKCKYMLCRTSQPNLRGKYICLIAVMLEGEMNQITYWRMMMLDGWKDGYYVHTLCDNSCKIWYGKMISKQTHKTQGRMNIPTAYLQLVKQKRDSSG